MPKNKESKVPLPLIILTVCIILITLYFSGCRVGLFTRG
jgi:hypothetical protein